MCNERKRREVRLAEKRVMTIFLGYQLVGLYE